MNKKIRQYIGLLVAITSYYIIHEGAHLIYALTTGTFKQINFLSLGIQIDIHNELMSNTELGIFCLVGSIATLLTGYILVLLIHKIKNITVNTVKAIIYYITISMLMIDPLYLSILYVFFGGGDMNGISLLIPDVIARIIYGVILVINTILFIKIVLPKYKLMFKD